MDPTFAFPTHWNPPPELMRAVPRETRISRRGMFNLILSVVFIVAACGLGLWLHNEQVRESARTLQLRAEGQEVTGEITRLWRQGKSSTPTVGYTFTANGIRMAGEAAVPKERWAAIQKAGFLPVRFLPSNPAVNHPAAWDQPTVPTWFPVMIPSVWAIGSAFLLANSLRQKRVAAEGSPAAAVVTKCFRIKGGWAARYQFRTPDGTVVKGRDRVWSALQPGATACVLYLPDNPRRNYLYPMALYTVVR